MKHELGQMRAQDSGAIVNCSSLGGLVGLPGRAAYHAASTALSASPAAPPWSTPPRGIRINAVCPGTIQTPMVQAMIDKGELDVPEAVQNQPIGRLGRAEEIAAAVRWLCSPTTQTPPSGCCGSRSVPSRSSPSMSATSGTVTPEAASHARHPSSASQPYEPHSGW